MKTGKMDDLFDCGGRLIIPLLIFAQGIGKMLLHPKQNGFHIIKVANTENGMEIMTTL